MSAGVYVMTCGDQRAACGSLSLLFTTWVWESNSGCPTRRQAFVQAPDWECFPMKTIGWTDLLYLSYIFFSFICLGCSVSVQPMCPWCPRWLKEGIKYPGTEVWMWAAMSMWTAWARGGASLSVLMSASGVLSPTRQNLRKVPKLHHLLWIKRSNTWVSVGRFSFEPPQ